MPNVADIMVTAQGSVTSRSWGERLSDAINAQDYYDPTDNGFAGAINAALLAANERGGGQVVVPNLGDIYQLEDEIVLQTNTHLIGLGRPTLRQKNGVNKSTIIGKDFLTLSGGDSGGIQSVSVRGFIIDGNRVNNGSAAENAGHGIAMYARDFIVDDVYIKNALRCGLKTEYSAGFSPYNGRVFRLTVDTVGEHGWHNRVSDTHVDDVNIRAVSLSADNTYDGIYCQAGGNFRGGKINVWSAESGTYARYGLNVETDSITLEGAHLETAKTANLRVSGNGADITDVHLYNAIGTINAILAGARNRVSMYVAPRSGGGGTKGIQLGEVGKALSGSIIDIRASGQTDATLDFSNSGGGNTIRATGDVSGASAVIGTPTSTDEVRLQHSTTGEMFTKEAIRQVTATGSTTSDALFLNSTNSTLNSTGAGQGVKIPTAWAVAGVSGVLINGSANDIKVYPHTGGNWQGLSANVAVTLVAGGMMRFMRATTGGWAHS